MFLSLKIFNVLLKALMNGGLKQFLYFAYSGFFKHFQISSRDLVATLVKCNFIRNIEILLITDTGSIFLP